MVNRKECCCYTAFFFFFFHFSNVIVFFLFFFPLEKMYKKRSSCPLHVISFFKVFPVNYFSFYPSLYQKSIIFIYFFLTGWTGEKVCLAGDSAGGNLCVTTSMRAAAFGVRMPDGIVAAYPATLLTAYASPSRLLTLMDPLLPLSVLSRCLSAYAGRFVCMCVFLIFT